MIGYPARRLIGFVCSRGIPSAAAPQLALFVQWPAGLQPPPLRIGFVSHARARGTGEGELLPAPLLDAGNGWNRTAGPDSSAEIGFVCTAVPTPVRPCQLGLFVPHAALPATEPPIGSPGPIGVRELASFVQQPAAPSPNPRPGRGRLALFVRRRHLSPARPPQLALFRTSHFQPQTSPQLALFVPRSSDRLLTTGYCLLALFRTNLHHRDTESTEAEPSHPL